jgi:hypothetical protein
MKPRVTGAIWATIPISLAVANLATEPSQGVVAGFQGSLGTRLVEMRSHFAH